MSEEARKLAEKYGGVWGEHPLYLVTSWQGEVFEDYTRASYWDWVLAEVEAEEE